MRTRQESQRLSGVDASAMQLDEILSHFEQYRRKHAAQNRDIVQANALAHARIRELEARVLQLESECAEHKLAAGRQSAHVRCLEYTLECVRVGWETMAHALRDCGVPTPQRTRERAASALPTPPTVRTRQIVLQDDRPTTRLPAAYATPLASEWIQEEASSPTPVDSPRVASPLCGDACPPSVSRRRPSRRAPSREPEIEPPSALDPASSPRPPSPRLASPHPPSPRPESPRLESPPPAPGQERAQAMTASPPDTAPPNDVPARTPTTPVRPRSPVADVDVPDRTRRTRKSINYALPKLNTKMRKPDPDDDAAADTKRPRTSRKSVATPSPPRRPRRSRDTSRRATPQVSKHRNTPAASPFQPRTNTTPFVPSRPSSTMPSWASSLLHLPSPEPPRHAKENALP